eukprot:gene26529-32060_t
MKAAQIKYHPLYQAFFFPYHRKFALARSSPIAELAAKLPAYKFAVEDKLKSNRYTLDKYSIKPCGVDGGVALGTLHEPNVSKMLKLAKPSPYGKGSKTVYDRTVRDGKELKHGRDFVIENEEDFLSLLSVESSELICDQLFPGATDIDYKINKIAIYEKGGHFKVHRDTAYASNHRGTLLIALQSPHRGGDLVLGGGARQVVWKTADADADDARPSVLSADEVGETDAMVAKAVESSDPVKEATEEEESSSMSSQEFGDEEDDQDADLLPWVSFPCSTLHKVLPVTEGIRMVLQVDLFTMTKDDYEPRDEEDVSCFVEGGRRVSKKDHQLRCADEGLRALVSAVAKDKRPAHALPLFSVYPHSSIQPQYLLPLDRSVFDAFVAAGFEVQLVPTVTKICSDWENNYASSDADHFLYQVNYVAEAYVRDPSSPEGYRLAEKKMAPMAETGDAIAMDKMNEIRMGKMDGIHELQAQIETLEKVVYHETLLHDAELMQAKDYVEFTGNEPSPAEHKYFTCAMILRKPKTVAKTVAKRKPKTATVAIVVDKAKTAGDV